MFQCFHCGQTRPKHQQYEIDQKVSVCSDCVDDATFICQSCEERRLNLNRSEHNAEVCTYCE